MISIIICGRKPQLDSMYEANIRNTIGSKYEMIVIDNSKKAYSIFQAYNEGIRRAKGDVLCFMHDDILFKSNNWGNIIEDLIKNDSTIGAIGVAGGHFMPDCPASWFTCHTTSSHIWQQNNKGTDFLTDNAAFFNDSMHVEVACIDGLWMCFPRKIFNTIRFDDITYDGFHGYDIDICMQVLESGHSVNVIRNVDIIHYSKGNCDTNFIKAIELWHKKWHTHLPITRGIKLTENEIKIHQGYAIELLEKHKETLRMSERLKSPEYKLGHFLLKPYRFIKRKLR